MIYKNFLPSDYCEIESCQGIYNRLNEYFNDDYELIARPWMNIPEKPNKKYISIVTSSEGHNHIPPERKDPNCMGVFMHYYPTCNPYQPILEFNDNIFPLPLGTKSRFYPQSKKPLKDRKYSVGFIGQFDQYRRVEFRAFALKCAAKYKDSYIQFYNGWNKGVSSHEYSELMGDTKIALVPCGSASFNTFRYYEAISSGCIIMSEEQYIHKQLSVNHFVSGYTVKNWEDEKLLFNLIDCGLSIDNEYMRVSNLRHYNNRLSPTACAEYIMDQIHE